MQVPVTDAMRARASEFQLGKLPATLQLDDDLHQHHLTHAARQFGRTLEHLEWRAIAALRTYAEQLRAAPAEATATVTRSGDFFWHWAWRIAVLLLLLFMAVRGHAQPPGLKIELKDTGSRVNFCAAGLCTLNFTGCTITTAGQTTNIACSSGPPGGGITTLNTLNATTQTFGKTDDTNVTLGITSAGSNHQFAMGWTGLLGVPRGGWGLSTLLAHQLYVGNGASAPNPVSNGVAGQVLCSNGASADPGFCDPITSGNQGAATTQTITATGALAGVTVTNIGTVLVTVSGTYAGVAFNFEGTPDGTFTPAFALNASQLDAAAIVTATGALPSNATRAWLVDAAGMTKIRLNATAWTSGTANITVTPVYHQFVPWTHVDAAALPLPTGAATAAKQPALGTAGSASTDVLSVQGVASGTPVPISAASLPLPTGAATSANQTNGTQQTQLTDGVTGPVAVKAASTAAAAADKSIVVALSPNSPVPTGSNTIGKTDQGAPNTLTNGWPVKPTDGTNSQAMMDTVARAGFQKLTDGVSTVAVKAASTAVAAADPSLAVGLSPNSPLPAGTNAIGGVTGTLTDNNAAPGANNLGVLPCIARTDYRGGTAATAGRAVMPDCGNDGLLHTATLPAMRPASYRASAIWSPVATTATDILRMPGNASNTVLVTQLMLSCTATTAGVQKVSVIKRSTAGSGGTSSNTAVTPMDSGYAAAVSVPVTYTANPTVGTIVGDVDDIWLGLMATATASPNDIYIGNFRQKPIVLRGTGENLVLNLNSVSIAGISCAASVEWMEITTITP
jgi:hypothetical protein